MSSVEIPSAVGSTVDSIDSASGEGCAEHGGDVFCGVLTGRGLEKVLPGGPDLLVFVAFEGADGGALLVAGKGDPGAGGIGAFEASLDDVLTAKGRGFVPPEDFSIPAIVCHDGAVAVGHGDDGTIDRAVRKPVHFV